MGEAFFPLSCALPWKWLVLDDYAAVNVKTTSAMAATAKALDQRQEILPRYAQRQAMLTGQPILVNKAGKDRRLPARRALATSGKVTFHSHVVADVLNNPSCSPISTTASRARRPMRSTRRATTAQGQRPSPLPSWRYDAGAITVMAKQPASARRVDPRDPGLYAHPPGSA